MTAGVYLRGEVLDENRTLIQRSLYHDLGSFGYVPAARDRGATGVALYGYGERGEYFDDVCVDMISARSEDDETDSLVWDTANVPSGEYYVYAVVSDGHNTIRHYSPGRIIVRHARPPASVATVPLPTAIETTP
jgi:hypothetical protein